jgi:hypothetical protein
MGGKGAGDRKRLMHAWLRWQGNELCEILSGGPDDNLKLTQKINKYEQVEIANSKGNRE